MFAVCPVHNGLPGKTDTDLLRTVHEIAHFMGEYSNILGKSF